MSHSFEVEKALFGSLPKLSVFFAVVRHINPSKVNKAGIQNFLEEAWKSSREQTSQHENVQSHPHVKLWRDAFTSMKISTKKYSSSVESMAKRASKADSKPFNINPLVDFYNAFSLKYILPFGGFDMASDVSKEMQLRFSKNGDKFLALDGGDSPIDVPVGEPSYISGNTVITRHINWKQSKEGLIGENTKDACFMAEVLGGYPADKLEALQAEFKKRCMELLHEEPEMMIVNEANPLIRY